MQMIKIALKSLLKKNLGNTSLLFCIGLLVLLPSLLYNVSGSVVKQVESSQKDVFGAFTDIVYAPQISTTYMEEISEEISFFLDGFNVLQKGVISTVYSEQLSDTRYLIVGYADEIAQELGRINLVAGVLPTSSDEIAVTESLAQFFSSTIGEEIEIANRKYTITGVVQDYGRLWVRGNEQDKKNISPINVFMTKPTAENLLSKTKTLTTQILLVKNEDNIINMTKSPYHFENVSITQTIKFVVPFSFLVINFALSIAVIALIHILSIKRIQKRISTYYCLGLSDKKIFIIINFERMLVLILGIFLGFTISIGMSHLVLWSLSKYTGQSFAFMFDYANLIPYATVFFIVVIIIIRLFTAYEIDDSLGTVKSERIEQKKRIKSQKKFSLEIFSLKRNKYSYIILIFIVISAFSLMSYGIFYGNYFRSDIGEAPPGTLPRDYDFQYIAHPQPAPPWQDKDDPIMFFTETLEKIGATENFIAKLKSDPMTQNVKAYKENNKYFTLLKPSQIDDYIDGSDFVLDGIYGSKYGFFNDFEIIRDKFGYAEDDVLVQSQVLGYPKEVLEQLSSSVVEGDINIEKIRSGEEVVLRVPAYVLKNYDDIATAHVPVEYTSNDAINCETLKVGDEITLTSLRSDEMINGAVPLSYLGKFEREDITVKIGAIIRSTDGILYSGVEQPLAFLTTNEAFDVLDIQANYSIVSVYANSNYSENDLTNRFAEFSAQVPTMEFQNWITDTKTYKIFNLMITIYVSILLAILAFTTLIVITSQLFNLTQFSIKIYTLLRLNGLKFCTIIRLIFIQSGFAIFIGGIIGIPVSFLLIRYFGIEQDLDVINEILYYFPIKYFLYVFALLSFIGLLAIIPSLIILSKNKNNILEGISSE